MNIYGNPSRSLRRRRGPYIVEFVMGSREEEEWFKSHHSDDEWLNPRWDYMMSLLAGSGGPDTRPSQATSRPTKRGRGGLI